MPCVCICIPTYNAELTIKETLLSLVNQSYPHLLIKVIDNASTDETLACARSIDDERIQVIEHALNVGGEGNFNRCIAYAEGDFTGIF
ncbi:MAG: glycosyltransferase family 2 protein, partial [Legionellaceae bacterium]